jgi:P4 family phage/plasmid primase-like protien
MSSSSSASSSSQNYSDLPEFLTKHVAKDKKDESTHTRMKDLELGIYPGSYSISLDEVETFWRLYYDYVFVKRRKEYLTEKQLADGTGPIVVDFDFRYDYSVDKRLHTKDDIVTMVLHYLEELKKFFVFDAESAFDIFIFEKPNVNRVADKTLTKDGIHMLIGLQMDHVLQVMLRENMLAKIPEMWSMPFTNTPNDILDLGISKGCTNWMLYGSRKPGCEAYEITHHYSVSFDTSDSEFMINELKVTAFDLKRNFHRLSVQYKGNPRFELNPGIVEAYEQAKRGSATNRPKRNISRARMNLLLEDDEENAIMAERQQISIHDITNHEILHQAMENILNSLDPTEYHVREAHMFTQILPEKYYEPGSHMLNRMVAFALKRTDERLFLSWVMLRSKASDFDFASIPSLYHDWKKYFNVSKDGVTKRSIMYWAKQDAFEDYLKVKNETIDHFIVKSCESNNDYGVALVLKQMYKDKYVCVSLTKGDAWYVFKNHRWQPDKGMSLRNAISEEMYNVFCKKRESLIGDYTVHPPPVVIPVEPKKDNSNNMSSIILVTMNRLRNSPDKNKFMREAAELFFDEDFIQNMDTNKYLLCFNNGVVDFKQKVFREGYPSDCITKCTGINYAPINRADPEMMKIHDEIIDFMEKLFPIPEQNKYMWDHLASVLIGCNRTQTFNIYHGSGSNGKSKLVDLMTLALGQYKAIVPVNLLTDKRVGIGSTSDEVLKLKGVRYAVGQELSKGMKLNEGIMKELSGGDDIQARGLYSESEKFSPQFKLVICTNNLFDIESNDDGTWRRIRRVVYYSKFARPEEMETFAELPYLYPMDTTIEDKLPIWAPVFAAMLVERAFITEGMVPDCPLVLRDSQAYRKGQDHIAAFVSEMIRRTGDPSHTVKKDELKNEFQRWYQMEQGDRRPPKPAELNEYMDKKFGPCIRGKGWLGIQIIYPEAEGDHMRDVH